MRDRDCFESTPTTVCFLQQNPISQDYLTRLLKSHKFKVVSEQEAHERHGSSTPASLILVIDERVSASEGQLELIAKPCTKG
jgi:hypothetical protein